MIKRIVAAVILVFQLHIGTNANDNHYVKSFREKFHESFMNKCYFKYPWVRKYVHRLTLHHTDNKEKKLAIFIYDDSFVRARKGGLGDRMGGIISTFVWAMRTNRTFLIEANKDGLSSVLKPFEIEDLPSKFQMKYAGNSQKVQLFGAIPRYFDVCNTA